MYDCLNHWHQIDVKTRNVRKLFEDDVAITHIDEQDIREAIKQDEESYIGRTIVEPKRVSSLEMLAIRLQIQAKKSETVFRMLDSSGKGVVVVEDLQRVAQDMLGEDVSDEDLVHMIQFFETSNDGMLTRDDFVRIARIIKLK